jgi:hypothetical protein
MKNPELKPEASKDLKLNIADPEKSCITFSCSIDPSEWIMKLERGKDNFVRILFNTEAHPNSIPDNFSKAVIEILKQTCVPLECFASGMPSNKLDLLKKEMQELVNGTNDAMTPFGTLYRWISIINMDEESWLTMDKS